MTEAEWLAEPDPVALLRHVLPTASDRKFRLYLCGGCREISYLFYHPASHAAVEVGERYADGQATDEELDRANWDAESPTFGYDIDPEAWQQFPGLDWAAHRQPLIDRGALIPSSGPAGEVRVNGPVRDRLLGAARLAEDCVRYPGDQHSWEPEEIRLDGWPGRWLVDCVFGNPFRPAVMAPGWLTPTAVGLAREAYEDRTWDRLPVLADALEDAGCDAAELLGHLRGPGPHARGCWAVDLVLGK